jgi:hypothetical protein
MSLPAENKGAGKTPCHGTGTAEIPQVPIGL